MLDTKKLDKILEAFKNPPTARVGILGESTARKAGELNNATIGAFHEFGTEGNENGRGKLPIRSFLRQPITNHLQEFLDKSKAFTKRSMDEVIRSGSLKTYVEKIGIVGEAVVAEAFHTGGFGEWEKSDMSKKKNHETLVETQQLRNSITSDVKE